MASCSVRVRSKREAGRKPLLASNAHQESPTRSDGRDYFLWPPIAVFFKNEEILILFHVSARAPLCAARQFTVRRAVQLLSRPRPRRPVKVSKSSAGHGSCCFCTLMELLLKVKAELV